MWTLLSTIEQIQSIKVGDLILHHPTNDSEALTNPTGKEENSIIYRVHSKKEYSKKDFEVTLEPLDKGHIFGDLLIDSMIRLADSNRLLNGKWWIM